MEDKAILWETKMIFIDDALDNWIKFQQNYLYLEPIFNSDDINKQMPKEAAKYKEVHQLWNELILFVEENPNVLKLYDKQGLLEKLEESLKLISQINAGLNEYLDKKRLFFPRFFFLSDEELLNILAETKDP